MTDDLNRRTLTGMNLKYGGRPVSWFGVGAPDAIGSGIRALEAAVAQYGGPGIDNFPGAVAGLQAAGTAVVSTVGPAIDALSGNDPKVMRETQLVWQQNSKLAGVDSRAGIGRADVDTAKGIVNEMIFAYKAASNLAASLAPKAAGPVPASRPGGSTTPPAAPAAAPAPPADDGGNTATWIAVAAGVFVLVVGGVIVATRG